MKTLFNTLLVGAMLLLAGPAFAQFGGAGNGGGECNSGFCGTPDQSGGGCGCGCGCSVLVAMTDRGDTYQFADDFDGDGIEDEFDVCPFTSDWAQVDGDGDGVGNACDTCAGVSNPLQENLDNDTMGDACDPDIDNDSIPNGNDNCPSIPNSGQVISLQGASLGDACNPDFATIMEQCRQGVQSDLCTDDPDGDGIATPNDNCPAVFNPQSDPTSGLQPDMNGDGAGDACDLDIDGDSIPNWLDNCANVANPGQVDLDHDGAGDAGNWGAGLVESCDSRECYVVPGTAGCLDPQGSFEIKIGTTLDKISFVAGDEIVLHLFTNRPAEIHSWTARFEKLPKNSDVSLENAQGSATTKDQHNAQLSQCLRQAADGSCEQSNDIRFTPDEPGTYAIKVNVQLTAGSDPHGLGSAVAGATATFEVGGESAGGCAAGASSGFGALALAALAFVGRRRTRK